MNKYPLPSEQCQGYTKKYFELVMGHCHGSWSLPTKHWRLSI